MLYNIVRKEPVKVELVLHRFGGIIRTYYKEVPWRWAFFSKELLG